MEKFLFEVVKKWWAYTILNGELRFLNESDISR